MSKGKLANSSADKNGCLKSPSQTDGLEFNPPTSSPNEPWVLLAQVDSEVAVFGTLEEPQRQVKSLPDAGADPRITTPLTKHQKQGLHFMMSKERDRDYTGSKGIPLSGALPGAVVVQFIRMSSPAIRQEQSPAKSTEAFSQASLVLERFCK